MFLAVLLGLVSLYLLLELLSYAKRRKFIVQQVASSLCCRAALLKKDESALAPLALTSQASDDGYSSALESALESPQEKQGKRGAAKVYAGTNPGSALKAAEASADEIVAELRLELYGLCEVDFSGKYLLDLERSDDSDDFLRLLGQNWFIRQAAKKCVVEVTINQTVEGSSAKIDVCSCISIIGKRIQWYQIIDGEEKVYEEQDGTKILCTSYWDTERHGGTWVMKKRNLSGTKGKPFAATEERWLQPDRTLVLWREYSIGTDTVRFTSYFNKCGP